MKLLVVTTLALASIAGCKLKAEKKEEVAQAAPPPQVAAPAPAPAPPPAPVGVNAGAFTIPKTTYVRGETIPITYNRDMTTPPGQQHWITLAKPGDVESAWGVWHYVKQGATTDSVTPPTAGEWEIRLHDLYPRYASRVLARQRISVQ